MSRDLGQEMDVLKRQMAELQQLVQRLVLEKKPAIPLAETAEPATAPESQEHNSVFYSGNVQLQGQRFKWEPQERQLRQLLGLNSEKAAKVLAAIGHKQRLDILKSVLGEPLSGSELVDRLQMGTTGQLYHHLKALLGADLLVQEPGGKYAMSQRRSLPFLLLLAAVSDMLDTSDYLDILETRQNPGMYLGTSRQYDAHYLLWEVVENAVLEHKAGFCSEVELFLHDYGSITVSDNGRGIPVRALPDSNISVVQSVLTDIHRFSSESSFRVPGAEKGISIAVVNALSQQLTVEIRREGKVFRQEYRHGIPQTGVLTVGTTEQTGTRVTFKPDPDLFGSGFDRERLKARRQELLQAYPELAIRIYDSSF